MLVQLLIPFFALSRFLILIIIDMAIFTKKKNFILAPRALREFVDSLKIGKKCQLSNEPTVVYLRQIQESPFQLFITKK